jgi:hypothetical protein
MKAMFDDELVIKADHDQAMARTLIGLERSMRDSCASKAVSAEFISQRCPQCNCSLLSDGKFAWCSFIGGRDVRACDYGIKTPVALTQPEIVSSEFIDSDSVCVKIDGTIHVSPSVSAELQSADLNEKQQLLDSLTTLDVSRFAVGAIVEYGSLVVGTEAEESGPFQWKTRP